jgi:hypothetical protein
MIDILRSCVSLSEEDAEGEADIILETVIPAPEITFFKV